MRLFIGALLLLHTTSIAAQEKLSIVASASMISDIAYNIIGDLHDIEMIVPIGGDPHLHEPTPSNAHLVANADLVLINGLTFEGWINELIENSGTKANIITVTEGVNVLTSQTYKNSADPHAWMDASNGIIYAENIASAMSKLDPINANNYNQNYQKYKENLIELDTEIEQLIASIPANQRILITSHDAFQYYGRRYKIRLEAIMGISTEAEAQTSDLTRVNKVIRNNKVPAIFIESTINPKMMQQLAQDNKISIGGKLFADSLGDEDSAAPTYIDMLRYDTKTIVSALSKSSADQLPQEGNKTNWKFLTILGLSLFLGLGVVIYLMNR